MPQRKNRAAHSFPCQVLGVASPYPIVVRVTCEINIINTTFRSRFCFVICRIIKVEASVQLWLITLTETSRLFQLSQKPNPIICFLTHSLTSSCVYILHKMRNQKFLQQSRCSGLRKHPFLLALRRWGHFAQRNFSDSATEIPY